MLFRFSYVPHSLETFQSYLDHLVKSVWCTASGQFSVDLLEYEFRDLVLEIEADPRVTKGKILPSIIKIFELFRDRLSPAQRQDVSLWYDLNNDIEAICKGTSNSNPVTYRDIEKLDKDIALELALFFRNIWKNVVGLSAVEARVGSLGDHYRTAFLSANRQGKCPFCGLRDMGNPHLKGREAYDHFLPKWKYPFNVINLKNLAPMCHECNSRFKGLKDPTVHKGSGSSADVRRRAFYSYEQSNIPIEIRVDISPSAKGDLHPDQIQITACCGASHEEVASWMDTFGIVEQFRGKCCAENDGKVWMDRIRSEAANYGKTKKEMLDIEVAFAKRKPWSDSNFLKAPFLIGCDAVGLFNDPQRGLTA